MKAGTTMVGIIIFLGAKGAKASCTTLARKTSLAAALSSSSRPQPHDIIFLRDDGTSPRPFHAIPEVRASWSSSRPPHDRLSKPVVFCVPRRRERSPPRPGAARRPFPPHAAAALPTRVRAPAPRARPPRRDSGEARLRPVPAPAAATPRGPLPRRGPARARAARPRPPVGSRVRSNSTDFRGCGRRGAVRAGWRGGSAGFGGARGDKMARVVARSCRGSVLL